MKTSAEIVAEFRYSDRILELFDNREELTQSDLQGALQAIVMDIVEYGKNLK